MLRVSTYFAVICLAASSAMAVDVVAMWDFSNPDLSEKRFRSALESAAGDDALILQTQIARTYVLRKDFEGKDIELIGQLMPDPESGASGTAKRFKAVRMFMYCCAADSRPIATLVETANLPELPEMTWVKVTGKPSFPIENGRRVSVVQASKVEKTEPPEEAMLY